MHVDGRRSAEYNCLTGFAMSSFWEVPSFPNDFLRVDMPDKTAFIRASERRSLKPYWREPPWFAKKEQASAEQTAEAAELRRLYANAIQLAGPEPIGCARFCNHEANAYLARCNAIRTQLGIHIDNSRPHDNSAKEAPATSAVVKMDLSLPSKTPAVVTPVMRHFLELGSAYWDTLHENLGHSTNWRGITVDARPELLARLPSRPNVEKLNIVVSPSDVEGDTVPFYYVPSDLVASRGFPQWLDGCGSTRRHHPILKLFSDEAVTRRDVRTMSLAAVLTHLPAPPDVVKTDLEGGDYAIVTELLDLGVRPSRLEFETVHMVDTERQQLFERLSKDGYENAGEVGDSVNWVLKPRQKKLLIYTDTTWALGQLHSGLASALKERGWDAECQHWWDAERQHWRAVANASARFDCILTLPGSGAKALADGGIPREKIVLVAHHEEDIAAHIKLGESFDGYRAYGVVSDPLVSASLTLGVSRVPHVVRVGVDFARYSSAARPTSLRTVGYGSIMKRASTLANVEMKRGELAEQCATEVGLSFLSTSSGRLDYNEMPAFYAMVDAVLVPSLMEGAGLPALEAAAAGRLVIGTPVGHFPRLAIEGCGLMAPIDAAQFREFAVERLRYYRANPEAFAEQCAAGQIAAKGRDWPNVVGDWVELLAHGRNVTSARGLVRKVPPDVTVAVQPPVATAKPIPKIIHHIWIGSQFPAEFHEFRQGWVRHHPDWTFLFWHGDEPVEDTLVAQVLSSNRFSPVVKSDILRLYALATLGGLYVDTDFECLKPFGELLSTGGFHCGGEAEGVLSSGLMACPASDPFVRAYLDAALQRLQKVSPNLTNRRPDLVTGPRLLTQLGMTAPITRHARALFYPVRGTERHRLSETPPPEAYARHHWAGGSSKGWLGAQRATITEADEARVVSAIERALH